MVRVSRKREKETNEDKARREGREREHLVEQVGVVKAVGVA